MKTYIHDNSINFRLSDVERLASEWTAVLDSSTAQSYIFYARQHELVFKQVDAYAEEIEE